MLPFVWNLHYSSIAYWKARGRLPIHHNWTFFAISYGWDAISWNLSKSKFFEGVGYFESKRRTGKSPTNHCWCQKNWVIALSCGIKISAVHCLVLSGNTRVTDRRTDRQNYDSEERVRLAASRGKNGWKSAILSDLRQSFMINRVVCSLRSFCYKFAISFRDILLTKMITQRQKYAETDRHTETSI